MFFPNIDICSLLVKKGFKRLLGFGVEVHQFLPQITLLRFRNAFENGQMHYVCYFKLKNGKVILISDFL